MKELFSKLNQILKDGRNAVLVTILAGSGSTPRGAGARMLVDKNGRLSGTIGGSTVEYRAIDIAREALAKGKSSIKAFVLRRNEVEDLGMICGGDVKVFFQVVTAASIEIVGQILSCFEQDEDSWLITDLTDESAWKTGVYFQQADLPFDMRYEVLTSLLRKNAVLQEHDNRLYYCEPLVQAGKVIVFGGGHVAQELVPLLTRVGFRCTVFDDREEFASRSLFPDANQVILGDFLHIEESVDIRARDYVVIMTRGHAWDYTVEKQVLQRETAYTGLIGSKTKIAAIKKKLRSAGISDKKIGLVHTPIGIPIKAKTPAEIAVSITAEMIRIRAIRAEAGL